jgi:hypothetical protein
MKKILLLAAILVIYFNVSAQLKLAEQFVNPPYTTSGDLGTQNSWVQLGSGTDVQVAHRSDNTDALLRSGYTSGRSSVTIGRYTSGVSGTDPYKPFNVNVSTNSNTVLFVSFLIRVTTAQNAGDYALAFRTANSNYLGRFFVRNSGTSVNFGIETDGTSSVDWTSNYSYNTIYLIIIRYDINNGDDDDDAYLWVNPSITTEPLPGSHQANVANTGDDDNTSLIGLGLRQTGTNSCEAEFDAFRVASGTGQANTAANASAAWFNLAPAGAPLPVKFGNITAFEKQNGIQVEWKSYFESNLSHYSIERSADGKTFTETGQVVSANKQTETTYTWFDANPLPGTSFYRIRHLDLDKKSGYSTIVRVSLDKSNTDITFYPNPVRAGHVSFQSSELSKGNYIVKVFNAAGQQVYTEKFNHNGGALNQTLQLPASLKPGMYILHLESGLSKLMNKSFIVQ